MELNAEQTKKALECCVKADTHLDCRKLKCPALINDECIYIGETVEDCDRQQFADALSLINSQEQRITELTEENERLKSEASVKRKLLDKAEVRIECVEEENNQLQADICNAEMNLGHITEDNQAKDETITNLIATIKDIQADTVRKMQAALEQRIHSKLTYRGWYLKEMVIPQIAKEVVGVD